MWYLEEPKHYFKSANYFEVISDNYDSKGKLPIILEYYLNGKYFIYYDFCINNMQKSIKIIKYCYINYFGHLCYFYDTIKNKCAIYKDELIKIALHPSRIKKLLDLGIKIGDFDNYI